MTLAPDREYGAPVAKTLRVNYALAGTLIASGMTCDEAAPKCNAKNGNALRAGLAKKGVTVKSARTAHPDLIIPPSVTARVAAEASEHLKGTFNRLLVKHVGKLEQIKPSSNLRKAKQLAEVIEPFARTAKTVNGWGDGPGKSLVNVNVLGSVRLDDLPDTGTPVSDPVQTERTPEHEPAHLPEQVNDPVQAPALGQ